MVTHPQAFNQIFIDNREKLSLIGWTLTDPLELQLAFAFIWMEKFALLFFF